MVSTKESWSSYKLIWWSSHQKQSSDTIPYFGQRPNYFVVWFGSSLVLSLQTWNFSPGLQFNLQNQPKVDFHCEKNFIATSCLSVWWILCITILVFYPLALKGKSKYIFPSVGCANFGSMKALGTSQLVPIRSPGTSCCQRNEGLNSSRRKNTVY